jgi:hypothetical protein
MRKLLFISATFFILTLLSGCQDNGHSHDGGSHSHDGTPQHKDSIN